MTDSLRSKLENYLLDTTGVYVNDGVDAREYFESLKSEILASCCTPFTLKATVMSPGFPNAPIGSTITGQCVAYKLTGHWLVYQPEHDVFYCFWGKDKNNLGAHGVFGGALYCWSA